MKTINAKTIILILLFCFLFTLPIKTQAEVYPYFAEEFLGADLHENYNRKMFKFNQGLNKFVIKPVHIIWASVMPQYGMDRLLGVSNNIEFPVRFVSSLVQGDFKNAGKESVRFLVNTTVGIGGMYDPAKRFLKIEQSSENMEQAIAKYHPEAKHYFIFPVIYFTTYRGLFGRVFDFALTPTTYIGTPITAAVKAVLTVNKTSYYQSLLKLLETSFADPYEVYKTAYGIDSYIKTNNFDRQEVISQLSTNDISKRKRKDLQRELKVSAVIADDTSFEEDLINYPAQEEEETFKQNKKVKKEKKEKKTKSAPKFNEVVIAPNNTNISFNDYNPQDPYTDSMRTMLFYLPSSDKSFWNEMSIWNRSFKNKIKTSEINLSEGRANYRFRYILQRDKNAPLAVVYPSTGDGAMASHPTMFAKMFYDEGYSVIIIGNPYQWEFTRSMPEGYRPGLPENDAKMLRMATAKIISNVEKKNKREFKHKVILGTSYAGITTLFMASQEAKDNTLGDVKFISICPPINLYYSISQLDETCKSLTSSKDEMKYLMANAAAKAVKIFKSKKDIDFEVNNMPFTEKESKAMTCVMMHQKLSDVIFVIEDTPNNKKSDIYEKTSNMGYKDYSEKYLNINTQKANKKVMESVKLTYISQYLETADNYKIYHTTNDYLINSAQLNHLKKLSGDRLVIMDNGSHMGFLYRSEFLNDLKTTIKADKNF